MSQVRPLPGVRFEVQPSPGDDALPRMDIPLFAGFAASGPVNVPVAVEDPAQFAMIFGGDIELPRPRGERRPRYAHLAPSVRAFFRHGGRRCWIVRIAATAAPASFRIPGLWKVNPDGSAEPAFAFARSQGSWADPLRVQTTLVSRPLQFVAYHEGAPGPGLFEVDVAVASMRDVVIGDLVRLSFTITSIELLTIVGSLRRLDAHVVRISGRSFISDSATPGTQPFASFTPPGPAAVSVLTFDLTVRSDRESPLRMPGLGFAPEHPRPFGGLPRDETLYSDPKPSAFLRETAGRRFPLAAEDALYLPMGMDPVLSVETRAEVAAATALERDGLARFDSALFLDPDLADSGVRDLLDRADALRYEVGRPLTGIHAALDVEEATMIAVPDAVYRGWNAEMPGAIFLPASPVEQPVSDECPPPCPTFFANCLALGAILPPSVAITEPRDGTYTLTWEHAAGATEEVQEATRFDYSDAATLFLGDGASLDIYGRPPGIYYYRLRRHAGTNLSAWTTAVVEVEGALGYVALDDSGEDAATLLEIQTAMLRMCAARADMVAILSLPRHFEASAAIGHGSALGSALDGQALSYGAIWHPWLGGRGEEASSLRTIPPDGAMAGVMAARAIGRGAWVAPANVILRGVVALAPALPAGARQDLQDAAINVIRQEPAGFLCLDADTLSGDDDLRPLNVRRLLILVRRAAMRTGNDYTFEPHSSSLRNAVKRGFESMLANMFQRGAFAGRTARDAYQVVTDETVNTQNSADNGRFIAELRIAPSRPLSFLTIRLLQRGGGPSAVEIR